MASEYLKKIIDALHKVSVEIRELERSGFHSLYEKGDKEAYVENLKQKTYLIVMLPSVVEGYVELLPAGLRTLVRDKIGGMSFSAEKALNLDSIFYMSAILYPENYKEGDLNDLEILIRMLQEHLK